MRTGAGKAGRSGIIGVDLQDLVEPRILRFWNAAERYGTFRRLVVFVFPFNWLISTWLGRQLLPFVRCACFDCVWPPGLPRENRPVLPDQILL